MMSNRAPPKERAPTQRGSETRSRIYATALALFRERGFGSTTMRDIATAAGMSLGAAYHYFRSKDAIVLAFYGEVHSAWQDGARTLFADTDAVSERMAGLFHLHHDLVRDDRALLAALVAVIADPRSPLSLFAEENRNLRKESLEVYFEALSVEEVAPDLRDLGALGLWALDMVLMLYFVWDESPGQDKTHRLVDDVVALVAGAIPILSLPMAQPFLARAARILLDAGLVED